MNKGNNGYDNNSDGNGEDPIFRVSIVGDSNIVVDSNNGIIWGDIITDPENVLILEDKLEK